MFDEIYILNLHGNARKKETAPDGSKDENVFDIMQGVSINIFVKRKGTTDYTDCANSKIREIRGSRRKSTDDLSPNLQNAKQGNFCSWLSRLEYDTIRIR